MKIRLYLLVLVLAPGIKSYCQEVKTVNTKDWNTLRNSGFFEADLSKSENNPGADIWYWGINVAHTSNSVVLSRPYQFNGQILFGVNFNSLNNPNVYVRSTNSEGNGVWAKLLHSKGNHAIDGKLIVKEVEVKVVTGADFVFNKDYKLLSLEDVESHIKEHKHLPDIASERDMQENGLNVNEFHIKLLQKIEELTLYVIDLKKENKEQSEYIKEQAVRISNLENNHK